MRITELTEKYLKEYLECVEDLNSKGVNKSDLKKAEYILHNRCENVVTLIGLVDRKLVAACSLILEDKVRYTERSCHIEDVAVMRDCRGKGYGKEILKYAIGYAKSEGCYKIMLTCKDDLVKYYSDVGFNSLDNNIVMYVKNFDNNIGDDLGD